MPTEQQTAFGIAGENHAAQHLERLGYTVVARRHRTRFGEIDLIVTDGSVLVFVEVKARRARSAGRVWDNLGPAKQRQVRSMARAYLAGAGADRPFYESLRFDAVGVVLDAGCGLVSLDHIEGAF